MVSIAESFYYRIFERKWRMGEALRGPSPCMPYSVSNKTKKKRKEKRKRKKNLLFFAPSLLSFFKQESELRRGQRRTPVKKGCGAWRGRLAWCLLCGREEGVWKSFAAFPFALPFSFFSSREAGAAKQNFLKKKHCVFLFY